MASNGDVISYRRHDLDNLRTFLTCLVTAHHTALAYGGLGSWYYHSSLFPKTLNPALMIFVASNQSWFMGAFFWISGRMSAQSLQRSSPGAFAKNKLIRLGIPAVVFTLVVQPLTHWIASPNWDFTTVLRGLAYFYKHVRGIDGPVWYTGTLLIFDLITAGVIHLRNRRRGQDDQPEPAKGSGLASHYRAIARWGWLGVAAVCFFIRLVYPVGTSLRWVVSVSLGYAPQYVFAYILGYLAYLDDEPRLVGPFDPPVKPAAIQLDTSPEPERGHDTEDGDGQDNVPTPTVPQRNGPSPGRYLAISFATVILPLIVVNTIIALSVSTSQPNENPAPDPALGGWSFEAVRYALWNEYGFATLGPAAMACFGAWFARPARSWIWQPRYSYAAFLLHAPVGVALEMLVDRALVAAFGADKWASSAAWNAWGPLLFTSVMSVLSAVASFVVGRWVVEYVPFVKRAV